MNTLRISAAALALAAIVGTATAAPITFKLKRELKLGGDGANITSTASTNFVGQNIMTVTTDGNAVWVGGVTNTGTATTAAIARIDNFLNGGVVSINRLASSVTSPAITSATGGYYGLTNDGQRVFGVVNRNAASADSEQLRGFDANTGNVIWDYRAANAVAGNFRFATNIDMDPGFGGGGAGVGISGTPAATFTGSRSVVDPLTGVLNGTAGNMTWPTGAVPGLSSTTRAISFDNNGDVYIRSNNQLGRVTRTGAHAGSLTVLGAGGLIPGTSAASNIGQNVEVFGFGGSKYVIMNDRTSGATGQSFTAKNLVLDTNGVAQSVTWLDSLNNALVLPTSSAIYDYEWIAGSNCLVVTDFTNNRLYAFQAVPEPATMAALGLGLAAVAARRRRKA